MSNCIYLVLGCYGRQEDDGFTSCCSAQNKILKIDESLTDFQEILYYIKSLRLYEKPLMDYNAVRRVIFNFQERYYQKALPIWPEKKFKFIENFTLMHKMCGIYLSLKAEDPSPLGAE